MQIYKWWIAILGITLISTTYASKIISQEHYLIYNDGQKIHLREKKLSSTKSGKVIVLVNPLSIPTLTAFDVPSYSLMNALANQGYDVWGIDFIGEGRSSYPAVMTRNPPPLGTYPLQAKDAVSQLRAGIEYISKKTGKKSLSLLGWSWGSVVAAMYSIQHPKQINHLVLYGSMYSSPLSKSAQKLFTKPYESPVGVFNRNLPAYQNIPWRIIQTHWKMMLNGNSTIVEPTAFNQVGKTYCQADPKPGVKNSLRRPMGPMKDLFMIWNGKPIYEISQLTTPTLVIYGDQDLFADHALYTKLTNVKVKQEIVLKEATHWLIYEKTRTKFVNDIISFLAK
jgi:pimeloyl-ACP methyl ester carboxylesterase